MKDFKEMSAHPGVEVNIMPVIGDSSLLKLDESQLSDALPVLALRNAVIFPGTVFPVTIGREKSILLIREMEEKDGVFAAVPQSDIAVEEPRAGDMFEFGVLKRPVDPHRLPPGF